MKKKIGVGFLVLIFILLMAGCTGRNGSDGVSNPTDDSIQEIGEGFTSFRLDVVDAEGEIGHWKVNTDALTVGYALLELGFISGDTTDFGLMIDSVNGITASWDEDNAFWAFYINGEFATAGADTTEIDSDALYSFVYSQG